MNRSTRSFVILAVSWIPALIGMGVPAEIAGKRAEAVAATPWWIPEAIGQLYLTGPIVVLSACVLFLSPGLAASALLGRDRSAGRLLARAFALSILILAIAAPVADAVSSEPLTGIGWAALNIALTVAIALLSRLRRQPEEDAAPTDVATLLAPTLLFSFGIAAALTPKFYWEDLSGDGAHALETGRLLLRQPLPFWSPEAGPHATFPGLKTFLFAYPASWFQRLFGDIDAAARFPLLLALPPLGGAILGLVEEGREKLGLGARGLLWGALTSFAAVSAFSATYSPYVSDIAMPTASDTVCLALTFGFFGSYFRSSWSGIVVFGLLALCAGPAATILLGLTALASLLFQRPRPLGPAATTILTVAFVSFVLPKMMAGLESFGIPAPGNEHSAGRLAERFRYLQFGHWERFGWLVVPCGVVPVWSLLRWRAQDGIARTLTVVTALYFGLFSSIAYVSLHYFVPTMLLPLVVHWRFDEARKIAVQFALMVGCTFALWTAIPTELRCPTDMREIAATLAVDIDGYEDVGHDVLRAADLLYAVHPPIGAYEVPERAFGTSSLALLRYASKTPRPQPPVLLLTAADAQRPDGAREAARGGGAVLYVLDEATLRNNRARRPRVPAATRLYAIEPAMLFVSRNISTAKVLDLKPLFPQPLTDLLGW